MTADAASLRHFILDGTKVSSLATFAEEFSRVVLPDYTWNGNLDAFNDILRGGFGTPEEGFVLVWRGSNTSRENLGYEQTVRELEVRLARCHPSNRVDVEQHIRRAKRREGPTVFDWLVEIIADHGPGGEQSADNVFLELE